MSELICDLPFDVTTMLQQSGGSVYKQIDLLVTSALSTKTMCEYMMPAFQERRGKTSVLVSQNSFDAKSFCRDGLFPAAACLKINGHFGKIETLTFFRYKGGISEQQNITWGGLKNYISIISSFSFMNSLSSVFQIGSPLPLSLFTFQKNFVA